MSSRSPSLVELVGAVGRGWCSFIGSAERGETWTAPGVSVGFGGEASASLNRIVAYGPDGVGDGVRGGVEWLRARRLPGVLYAASPVVGEAAEAAAALGLRPGGGAPVMCAQAGDVVRAEPGRHDVVRVMDVEGVQAAGDVLADAFELPADWCQRLLGVSFPARSDAELFISRHDGRPVAVAGSARVGRVAGVYAVGARHAHRRRGAGAAAVSAALDHHLRGGAHWFGLFSDDVAEPFCELFGFVAVDHAATWVVDGA